MNFIRGFFLVGLLNPYGLIWNRAVVVFISCSCFVWSLVFERIKIRVWACSYLLDFVVQVGRGRHSDFEWGY